MVVLVHLALLVVEESVEGVGLVVDDVLPGSGSGVSEDIDLLLDGVCNPSGVWLVSIGVVVSESLWRVANGGKVVNEGSKVSIFVVLSLSVKEFEEF
jgi:hypothetical protein